MNDKRATKAAIVTGFATGWPDEAPHILVLSLTTHQGVQDFALTKEQAQMVAKAMNDTADQLVEPKTA